MFFGVVFGVSLDFLIVDAFYLHMGLFRRRKHRGSGSGFAGELVEALDLAKVESDLIRLDAVVGLDAGFLDDFLDAEPGVGPAGPAYVSGICEFHVGSVCADGCGSVSYRCRTLVDARPDHSCGFWLQDVLFERAPGGAGFVPYMDSCVMFKPVDEFERFMNISCVYSKEVYRLLETEWSYFLFDKKLFKDEESNKL